MQALQFTLRIANDKIACIKYGISMKPAAIENIVREQVELVAQSAGVSIVVKDIGLTRPKRRQHGDFTSNIALRISKQLSMSPLACATALAEQLTQHPQFSSVTAVAPGFINFFIADEDRNNVIAEILDQKERYGMHPSQEEHILLEFISSNPTGPLHTGHGRGAAYGSSLASLLRRCGYQVSCEYYLNDAGRQISILAISVWIRYLHCVGYKFALPQKCYQGEYLVTIGKKLHQEFGNTYIPEQFSDQSISTTTNSEEDLDALIADSRNLLGKSLFEQLKQFSTDAMVATIKQDLVDFNVHFDSWFSEKSLLQNQKVQAVIKRLDEAGALYQKDDAIWFSATSYGDNKDRVIQRSNGEYTYFATDIAYHADKFDRGFDRAINLFGADHHGYIKRLKSAMTALGYSSDKLEILLIQLAYLMRNKKIVSMSTRSGSFVELSQLIAETGTDAARFFYLTRRHEQHLVFDVDLAASQSKDNPVYYVQYAYARVSQIVQQAQAQKMQLDQKHALNNLATLQDEKERNLIDLLSRFPRTVEQAGKTLSPYLVSQYLRDLAAIFHNYYASVRILDTVDCWQQRVCLCLAVQQVIANGLDILGVSTPEQM